MASGGFFRQLRILILLFILFMVAVNAWLTELRATDWDRPLWIAVYPINGDRSSASSRYIQSLEEQTFEPIEVFLEREARRYGLPLDRPINIELAPEVDALPPQPPSRSNVLGVMAWSLKLRYWAWRVNTYDGPENIQMFIVYYDPIAHERLGHSLGLEKGLVGVVNAFAGRNMAARNNLIIAHELLHTVGATDKYDLANNQPLYPIGYAEPKRRPLLPQRKAEIMGGRIPVSEGRATMPRSLKQTVIGEMTATEIRWLE